MTALVVALCFAIIRRHYRAVEAALTKLYAELGEVPRDPGAAPPPLEPQRPTAAVSIQKRLQWAGRTMVILPARVR